MVLIFVVAALGLIAIIFVLRRLQACKQKNTDLVVGFFHPYCNSGGGGERVLWMMILSLLSHKILSDKFRIVVYSGDHNSFTDIVNNAKVFYSIII